MGAADTTSRDAGAWFVEADHVSVTALARRRSRARMDEERAKSGRVVIVSSLFLVLFTAALLIGGQAAIDPILQSAMNAWETKGTGDVVEAVRHMRTIMDDIRKLQLLPEEELMTAAKDLGAPYELVREVARTGKLPVVNFSAGGIATPADAALMMRLGAEGVFVGSGIFKSGDPLKRAKAIVYATTHFEDPAILAEVSRNLRQGSPRVFCLDTWIRQGTLLILPTALRDDDVEVLVQRVISECEAEGRRQ